MAEKHRLSESESQTPQDLGLAFTSACHNLYALGTVSYQSLNPHLCKMGLIIGLMPLDYNED